MGDNDVKKYEYYDPYELSEDKSFTFGMPDKIANNVKNPESVALWNFVMRKVTDGKGKTVLSTADTVSQVLARKIFFFMNDEDHIMNKFYGDPPKAMEIYKAAKFSKSKWGRLMGGVLSDIERGTVYAIAIALRLNTEQTEELLYSAGIAVNYELDLDVAMMYFIKREIYDMDRIYSILGEFCNVENGLDRFMFQPRTK